MYPRACSRKARGDEQAYIVRTRPNFMKMAPVIAALRERPARFSDSRPALEVEPLRASAAVPPWDGDASAGIAGSVELSLRNRLGLGDALGN